MLEPCSRKGMEMLDITLQHLLFPSEPSLQMGLGEAAMKAEKQGSPQLAPKFLLGMQKLWGPG